MNEEQVAIEPLLSPAGEGAGAGREDDLDRVRNLERQIVEVDVEMDQRAYVLYGLTEEEVKVVERK